MKIVERFGKFTVATFIIMGIGLLVWVLVIPLYGFFKIDTDIPGIMIFLLGLLLFIAGVIAKRVGSRKQSLPK